MKNAKFFVLSILVVAIATISLVGCDGNGYEKGYRDGLRRAASYFGAEEFDLEAWVATQGGKEVKFEEPDGEMGRTATVSWWRDRFRIEVSLADGEVTVIERKPFRLGPLEIGFLSGGEEQADHWWSPQLSEKMVFLPNGEGYAVSADLRGVCQRAAERVDTLLATAD